MTKYFAFVRILFCMCLQCIFTSSAKRLVLTGRLEVGFVSSSSQKQEQGFSKDLSHIPSACVLSIKQDVACGACSSLFLYLFLLQMHELCMLHGLATKFQIFFSF